MFPNPVHMVGGGVEVGSASIPPEIVTQCFHAFDSDAVELSFDVYSAIGDENKRLRQSLELKRVLHDQFADLFALLDEFVLTSLYGRGEGYCACVARQQLMMYRDGAGAGLHVDDQFKPPPAQGKNRYVMHLLNQFAGILYISSDDLMGGELVFPNEPLSVEPTTGTLVAFPSNYLFPHLVRPVTKGKRIAIARHYYVKDSAAV